MLIRGASLAEIICRLTLCLHSGAIVKVSSIPSKSTTRSSVVISASTMTSNVLPLFWNLSSTTKSTRLDASERLITSLVKFQEDYLVAAGKGGAVDEDEDEDDEDDEDGEEDDEDESGVEVS